MSRGEQFEIQERQMQGPTSKEQTFQTQCTVLKSSFPFYFILVRSICSNLLYLIMKRHAFLGMSDKILISDFFINYWSKEIPWKAAHFHLPFCQTSTGAEHEPSPGSSALPILAWLLGLSREPWQLSVSLSCAVPLVRCWHSSTAWIWKGNKAAEGKPQGGAQWEQPLILYLTETLLHTESCSCSNVCRLLLLRQVQTSWFDARDS